MSALGRIAKLPRSAPELTVIVAAFLLLATLYSIVTPIFEAGDEIWHYPFVQHLATGHSLPVQDPAVKTLWEQEGGQPPLYYALGAIITSWIDTRDLADRLWTNPHAKIGIPLVLGNKNLIVHTNAEDFPWHGTTLAVHLLRFFSILLSAESVALTYQLARELKTDRRLATVAAALVAFNPMFLFISASVNNDNLAVLLATLALVLLVRLVARPASLRDFVILGIVLGLGALTKIGNAGLFLLAGLGFLYLLWRAWRSHEHARARRILVSSVTCAAVVLLIAGWWYARNWILYGDPLAFNVWVAVAGGRPIPATLALLVGEVEGFLISFWGNFGGVNIIAPGWVYLILNGLALLAVLGLVLGMVRRTLPSLLAIPALWVVLIIVSLIRWTWLTLASQGRLVFPAIAAIAVLFAFGIDQIASGEWRMASRAPQYPTRNPQFAIRVLNHLPWVPVTALFLFALAAPFSLIAPTYAQPVRVSESSVPNPTHITFEERAELVGYALPRRVAAPGEELPLTLYWRGLQKMDEDYSVYIHLYDSDGNKVGQWDAFPGGGVYPTRLWQPGEIIVDNYQIPITPTTKRPSVGRVEAGLYRRSSAKNLVARDPQNRVITPTLTRFKIDGRWNVTIADADLGVFGRRLKLAAFALLANDSPSTLRVGLWWQAIAPIKEDYVVFVHLLDSQGNIVAQKDDEPRQKTYPTSFWEVGEIVPDEYLINLVDVAPGDYVLEVGVYSSGGGPRLTLESGADSIHLGRIPVGR